MMKAFNNHEPHCRRGQSADYVQQYNPPFVVVARPDYASKMVNCHCGYRKQLKMISVEALKFFLIQFGCNFIFHSLSLF